MPFLANRTISNFPRSECLRRLRLDLSPDNATYRPERVGMPPRGTGRPGIAALTAAGTEWEEAKIADLRISFGAASIIAPPASVLEIDLATALTQLTPQTLFIVQGQYAVGNA